MKTEEKSNEITAIPELLKVLELKGAIVTIDAMGRQEAIVGDIVEGDCRFDDKSHRSDVGTVLMPGSER